MSVTPKKAIVTGGAQGIGKAVSEKLLDNECSVAILDVRKDLWDVVKSEWNEKFPRSEFYFVECDLLDRDKTLSAFEQTYSILDGLDIVINNAGIYDELNWERCIDINFKAMMRVINIGINLMSKDKGRNGGVIINSASVSGLGQFPVPAYGSTKHAITALTRSLGTLPGFLKQHGVRINSVCLGYTETAILKQDPFKQGNALDDFPSVDSINMFRDEMLERFPYQHMIPIETAVKLYLQLINDQEVHGKNLFYVSSQQEKPKFHEYQGISI